MVQSLTPACSLWSPLLISDEVLLVAWLVKLFRDK